MTPRPHLHPPTAEWAPSGEEDECGKRNVDTNLNTILVVVAGVDLVNFVRLGDNHTLESLPGGTGGLDDGQLGSR